MLDHVFFDVGDVAASRAFYERALAPLGITVVLDHPDYVGFGVDRWPRFFVAGGRDRHTRQVHVAFMAADRAAVDAFHAAALAAGGVDNGAPGPRPRYHRDYYGAFVLDPDGNNIEAVCHTPTG
jgi:catechol 2,3-dioxygenase-like lactoylglutathione lyase family enzyme